MLVEAMRNINQTNQTVELAQIDGRQMGLAMDSFDYIIMVGQMITFIPGRINRVQVLAECYRVLKPGGRLIFSTHSRNCRWKYRAFFAVVNPLRRMRRMVLGQTGMEENDRFTRSVSRRNRPAAVFTSLFHAGGRGGS